MAEHTVSRCRIPNLLCPSYQFQYIKLHLSEAKQLTVICIQVELHNHPTVQATPHHIKFPSRKNTHDYAIQQYNFIKERNECNNM
jgi:hypothetical protein